MKEKIKYIITIILILLTIFNFDVITNSIKMSFNICINNLLPSIIPFLLISSILINFTTNNIFYLTILSIISGSPSSSKYIKDYLDNDLINVEDASILINYLQYFNPVYILSVIGITTLNNKKLGLIILLSNILSSFIIRKKVVIKTKSINRLQTFDILTKTIKDLINTLLYIIGVITTFFILTSYIDIILNINIKYRYLYGLIEITQGINYLKYSNLNIYLKTVISSFFISFGGVSMHVQIFGILNNKKIRYKPYFLSRIKHSIITVIISSILFYILM